MRYFHPMTKKDKKTYANKKWVEKYRRQNPAFEQTIVILIGQTFKHKELIKSHGGKWNNVKKIWTISQLDAETICKLFPKEISYEQENTRN